MAPGGGTKSFNTRQEAINAISAGNGGIKSFSDGQTAATTPVSENEKVIQQYKDEIKLMQDAQNVKDEENRNFMTNMFNTMTQQQAASASTIQGITNERMTGLQNTYTDIDNQMNQLEIKANAVFDQGAMRQAVAKARQLAAQGYMTNEQVAQVANYDVSAYRRDAELAKTTLEKDIAAQRITLDQSKLAAVDAIQKDMSINEQQRAANIQQINTRYGNMTDSLNSKESASKQLYEGLNNQYNQMAAGQDVAQQGVLGADTAQYNLQQQQKQRAISDPVARRDYIINQVKDSNVLKYVDTVIKKMQQSGNFMAADVDTLMQNVLAQATLLQKQNEAAGAHAGMS